MLYAHHRMDSGGVKTNRAGFEEGFWGTETRERDLYCPGQAPRELLPCHIANSEGLPIREVVVAFDRRRTHSGVKLPLEIKCDVAQFLLDIPDQFSLSGGLRPESNIFKPFGKNVSEVTASQVRALDGMGDRESLVNCDSV